MAHSVCDRACRVTLRGGCCSSRWPCSWSARCHVDASPGDEAPPTDCAQRGRAVDHDGRPDDDRPRRSRPRAPTRPSRRHPRPDDPRSRPGRRVVRQRPRCRPPRAEGQLPSSPDDAVATLDAADDGARRPAARPVTTDKDDYLPESTVLVSGSGYGPGCRLLVEVTRDGSVVRGDVISPVDGRLGRHVPRPELDLAGLTRSASPAAPALTLADPADHPDLVRPAPTSSTSTTSSLCAQAAPPPRPRSVRRRTRRPPSRARSGPTPGRSCRGRAKRSTSRS